MKQSIKCPHCGERIKTFHVSVYTYYVYNPNTDKCTKRVGMLDHEDIGMCAKCGGEITTEMFKVNPNA